MLYFSPLLRILLYLRARCIYVCGWQPSELYIIPIMNGGIVSILINKRLSLFIKFSMYILNIFCISPYIKLLNTPTHWALLQSSPSDQSHLGEYSTTAAATAAATRDTPLYSLILTHAGICILYTEIPRRGISRARGGALSRKIARKLSLYTPRQNYDNVALMRKLR